MDWLMPSLLVLVVLIGGVLFVNRYRKASDEEDSVKYDQNAQLFGKKLKEYLAYSFNPDYRSNLSVKTEILAIKKEVVINCLIASRAGENLEALRDPTIEFNKNFIHEHADRPYRVHVLFREE